MEQLWNYQYLVEKYIDTVYRIALNWLKSSNDADDITQNVMAKLITHKNEFIDENHIKSWLIRVTINECKSYSHSFWLRNITSIQKCENSLVFRTPEQSDLYDAVTDLPGKYRIVIYLYYYEDYSVAEISGLIGVSETAIQNRLMRARAKLKKQLKGGWNND